MILTPATVTPLLDWYVEVLEAANQPTTMDPPIQVFRAGRWMVVSA